MGTSEPFAVGDVVTVTTSDFHMWQGKILVIRRSEVVLRVINAGTTKYAVGARAHARPEQITKAS